MVQTDDLRCPAVTHFDRDVQAITSGVQPGKLRRFHADQITVVRMDCERLEGMGLQARLNLNTVDLIILRP